MEENVINKKRQASITVEASLVTPIFFLGLLSIMYFLKWMDGYIQREYEYVEKLRKYSQLVIIDEQIKKVLTEKDEEIILMKSRTVKIPMGLKGLNSITIRHKKRARGFVGRTITSNENNEEEWVYVAEYGQVYHEKRSCTHLQLKIQSAMYKQIKSMYNASGQKYGRCKKCVKGKLEDSTMAYIGEYGTCFHSKRNCSGLKRTVYKKRKQDVESLSACIKCAGE